MEILGFLGLLALGHLVSGILALYLIGWYDTDDRLAVGEGEEIIVVIAGYIALGITLLQLTSVTILKSIHKRGLAKRMEKEVNGRDR